MSKPRKPAPTLVFGRRTDASAPEGAVVERTMTCQMCPCHTKDDACDHPDSAPELMHAGALANGPSRPVGCGHPGWMFDLTRPPQAAVARDHHPGPHAEGSPGEKAARMRDRAREGKMMNRDKMIKAVEASEEGRFAEADEILSEMDHVADGTDAFASGIKDMADAHPDPEDDAEGWDADRRAADVKESAANAKAARDLHRQAKQRVDTNRETFREMAKAKRPAAKSRAVATARPHAMRIARADRERQMIYLIASRVDDPDGYGYVMDAEEVERSAHRFMRVRVVGFNHLCSHEGCFHGYGAHAAGARLGACREDDCACTSYEALSAPGVELVENFIAGADAAEGHGAPLAEPFKRGDHVIGLKVHHALLWMLRDEITGCSWEGTVELAPMEEPPPHPMETGA